jgi:hypothetical protein
MAQTAPKSFIGSPIRGAIASWMIFTGLLLLLWLLAPAFGRDQTPSEVEPQAEPTPTFSLEEQAEMRKAVEAVLPAPWTVRRTKFGMAPPDWYSDDPRGGFVVECSNGEKSCQVWFLPVDWVGILTRTVPAGVCTKRGPSSYWDGIQDRHKYKTILEAPDGAPWETGEAFRSGAYDPDLSYWGYERAEAAFGSRAEAADRAAQRLIAKHCTTQEDFDNAVHSLRHLGVPARRVFLRAAREPEGSSKDGSIWLLGVMGGDDAIGALCEVLSDPKEEDREKGTAAEALERHTDKRIGPALHKAMKQMQPGREAFGYVVKGLGRQRYEAAIPDLLKFLRDPQPDVSWPASQALAMLHCKGAIPDLRKIVEQHPGDKDKPPERDSYEMALLRLEGDWGQAGEDCRYMMWAPREITVGQRLEVTIYKENLALKPVEWSDLDMQKDDLVVNGKPLIEQDPRGFRVFVGCGRVWSAYPGEVSSHTLDLSQDLTKPGRYTIRYGLGDVHSNEAVVVVHPAQQ